MIVGFTGTQFGMTKRQRDYLMENLLLYRVTEFHHGDCVGADAEAHEIALECGVPRIVIHPPEITAKRAHCKGRGTVTTVVLRTPRPYLDRNHDIVNQSQMLIAAPRSMLEQLRSGTWATVRFARQKGKEVILLAR